MKGICLHTIVRVALGLFLCFIMLPSVSAQDTSSLLTKHPLDNNTGNQIKVFGVVKDKLGNPLVGVTVRIRQKSEATMTNVKGEFTIVAEPTDFLEISYVGYQKQIAAVLNQTKMQIVLDADAGSLDEVVMVAYGHQKKESVTGAIESIGTKEIKQSPAANLAVALAGRLPGLTVIQSSGEPGKDVTSLFLRGMGTLNGKNPIILVDGIEREMTYIDPNEVESVTILKDASSTAMFGVRGANGVILVTTRRGDKNKQLISLTAETGLQDFTRRVSSLDAFDWATLKNQAWHNDNPNVSPDDPINKPPYSDYALERYKLQDDPLRFPNNDWHKMLMHKFVSQTRYNLNISGGGNRVQYFVNVGYLDQNGQWKVVQKDYDPSSYMKRYNFRSNIDATLNKSGTLKTFLNLAGYVEKINSPFQNDIFRYINDEFPNIMPGPLTPDGEVLIGPGIYGTSPYAMINRSGYSQGTNNDILASWGLEQNLDVLTKGLSVKFMASFDSKTLYQLNATQNYETWAQIIDPNLHTADGKDSVFYNKIGGTNTPLSVATGSSFEYSSNFQFLLNYNRTFLEKHAFTGLIIAQRQERVLPGDRLPYNLIGVAGRLTYGYDNTYFAEFDAGYNGSEQFAKGRRFGFFPSISGAWVISNENFMKQFSTFLSLFKIRGSYGEVGNDQLGGKRFLYLDDIQRGGGGYSPSLGDGATINESYVGNPDIRWEVAKKMNFGLEIGLFKELNLKVDFFNEKRNNVLITRGSVPLLNGVPQDAKPPANIGIVENHGYEFVLNYNKHFTNEFSVFSSLNFNFAKNKVVFSDEAILPEGYAARYRQTGYPIGQNFGYIVDGYFKDQNEINNYAAYDIGRAPRAGDFKYKDMNGDNIIDSKDISPIGYSHIPQYTYGASFGIDYKGFSLSLLFQGVANVSADYTSIGVYETYDFRKRMLKAWTPERAAAGAEILYPALSTTLSSSNLNNTFFLENTSFIRLKNVEIGYSLPKSITKRIGAQVIRIYINGVNLFTWDKMKSKDYDPEITNSKSYPVYRVFNSGINITF